MMKTLYIVSALILAASWSQAQPVTDIDGNLYDTVIIGNQVWLKQNLRVTHYNNGTLIPNVIDSATWAGATLGARCYYDDDSVRYNTLYGVLYNWYAITNVRLICPVGWDIPGDQQWTILENFLGGATVAGGELKEAGFIHWMSPNVGATNSTGFTGLPGGVRYGNSAYQFLHENGMWWTRTSVSSSMAYSRYLWYMNAGVDRNPTQKLMGLSIRCMRNLSSGIGESIDQSEINLYPNPSTGNFTVSFPDHVSMIQVSNYLGQVLNEYKTDSGTEMMLSVREKGIYFIRFLIDKTEYLTRKVVVY